MNPSTHCRSPESSYSTRASLSKSMPRGEGSDFQHRPYPSPNPPPPPSHHYYSYMEPDNHMTEGGPSYPHGSHYTGDFGERNYHDSHESMRHAPYESRDNWRYHPPPSHGRGLLWPFFLLCMHRPKDIYIVMDGYMLIAIGSFYSYLQVHDIRTDTKAIINPVAITVTLEGFRTTGGVIILRVHITTTDTLFSINHIRKALFQFQWEVILKFMPNPWEEKNKRPTLSLYSPTN